MASEIRVDKINSLSGVGTVSLSPTGVDISGITTAATLKATTGIVTTLTATTLKATTGIVTTLTATTGIVTTLTTNTAKVGAAVTITESGIFATGVCTATTFKGDGSQLSNITSVGGATGVDFNDDVKVRFGASNDLQLYHDSSANKSKIETTAGGNLDIGSTHNADVQIKTNSVNRFNFGAAGFAPLANDTYDLGSTTNRWQNVYTTDLQLSNEGKTNDVDGTWGNYTIQEGESDLFLINNRNGKKYKFMLQEVS